MKNEPYLPEDFLTAMADVIKLLGNAQRLRILEFLDIRQEASVTEIVDALHFAQGAVSQHLTKLRMANVVASRREGKNVLYRIAAENAVTILNCMRRKCAVTSKESEK